jgi:hypothetical protein
MALFSKNTLTQVSGFDNQIISGELVYNQRQYWNLVMTSNDEPIDLTDVGIDAQIIRRQISNLVDTRNGLSFDIADYEPPPTPVNMTITNRHDTDGMFTLVIDESAWDVISTDPELNIAAVDPVAFSGRIIISFEAVGETPAQDLVIFLLFLVRSDGVVN